MSLFSLARGGAPLFLRLKFFLSSLSERKAGGSGISSPATIPTPLSSSQSNPFSRVVSSNIPLGNFVGSNRSSGFGGIGIGGRPATPTFELPTGILSGGPLTPIDRPSSAGGGNNRNRKSNQNGGNNRIGMGGAGGNKGSSNLSRKKEEEFEEELEDGEEEKDETLYCTCQRVSFGEVSKNEQKKTERGNRGRQEFALMILIVPSPFSFFLFFISRLLLSSR